MALIQALLLLPLLASACAAGGDGSNPSVLQLPAVADVDIASGTALDYTVSPSATGTLLAGQDLMQAERLYSPDRSVFLVPQTDGNLVIYNAYAVAKLGHTAAEAAIWESGTYNNGGPQPFTLAMQEDCNLVLYNGNAANNGPRNAGDAVFSTGTYSQGVAPCSLVVSDAGLGGFVVVDSTGAALYSTLRVLGIYPVYGQPEYLGVVYDVAAGTWSSVGMTPPVADGFAGLGLSVPFTRLHDGSVLVAGGAAEPDDPAGIMNTLPTAFIFSPAALAFRATGNLTTPRAYFTLVTALNGAALAIGGVTVNGLFGPDGGEVTGSIEVYSSGGFWSPAGSMITPRDGHVSVVLPSGRVLTTGGYVGVQNSNRGATSSAELYDPILGVSTATAPMSSPRVGHSMVLLADGAALACGGLYPIFNGRFQQITYLSTCETYNESSEVWEPTGNLTGRGNTIGWVNFVLSLLPNGQVLASNNEGSQPCQAEFTLFDPHSRTWSVQAPVPSFLGPQILLPTGELLLPNAYTSVAQCLNATGTPASTLLYNPITGSQKLTGSLPGVAFSAPQRPSENVLYPGSTVLF